MQNELFFFTSKHHETRLQVLIKDENVWLNRQQLAILFDRDIKTIGKHISNAKSEELYGFSVVAKFATTAIPFNSSFRMLEICLPMVLTSLSNKIAN